MFMSKTQNQRQHHTSTQLSRQPSTSAGSAASPIINISHHQSLRKLKTQYRPTKRNKNQHQHQTKPNQAKPNQINMGEESITPSQVTTSIQKKKKSLFKSIKGSLKRKKKKSHPDDGSVGVSVASNSVAAPSNTLAPSAINGAPPLNVISEAPIQIILLLMDPQSRRFELLQLEFSADKALVSDILVQISQSATEKTLREMEYGGVCDRSGMELIRSMKLSSVVKGKIEVVLAMPKGMGGKEVGEMARPILEDAKVVEMVRYYIFY